MATTRHSAGVANSDHLDADFIASAAAPIAAALAAAGQMGVPTADVLVSYTARGCTVRVTDRRAGR